MTTFDDWFNRQPGNARGMGEIKRQKAIARAAWERQERRVEGLRQVLEFIANYDSWSGDMMSPQEIAADALEGLDEDA